MTKKFKKTQSNQAIELSARRSQTELKGAAFNVRNLCAMNIKRVTPQLSENAQLGAISGQLNIFQPKVNKTDIGEIYIHVSNSLAECCTLIADSSLIGLWLN